MNTTTIAIRNNNKEILQHQHEYQQQQQKYKMTMMIDQDNCCSYNDYYYHGLISTLLQFQQLLLDSAEETDNTTCKRKENDTNNNISNSNNEPSRTDTSTLISILNDNAPTHFSVTNDSNRKLASTFEYTDIPPLRRYPRELSRRRKRSSKTVVQQNQQQQHLQFRMPPLQVPLPIKSNEYCTTKKYSLVKDFHPKCRINTSNLLLTSCTEEEDENDDNIIEIIQSSFLTTDWGRALPHNVNDNHKDNYDENNNNNTADWSTTITIPEWNNSNDKRVYCGSCSDANSGGVMSRGGVDIPPRKPERMIST